MRFLVDGIVLALFQARDDLREFFVELGRFLRRTADNERRARFVDEDRVDFVDEREIELTLYQILHLPRHVVAQVIEADLIVGDVGDVAGVLCPAFGRFQAVLNDADRQPEELIDLPHPFRVAPSEIVVGRHECTPRPSSARA